MGQYRVNDHPYHAPQFINKPIAKKLLSGQKNPSRLQSQVKTPVGVLKDVSSVMLVKIIPSNIVKNLKYVMYDLEMK